MAIVVPIISEWNAQGVDRAMADIQKAGSGFDKFALGIEKASRLATIALGGLAVAGFSFAKAAAEDEQAAAVLSKTLKNTTKATDKQVASVEEWIKSQGKLLGITDEKLRPALGKLVTATKDVDEAQKLASLAMDISAARGLDLESVSQSLAKAYGGNFTALNKLLPGIDQAALASGNWTVVQKELNNVVGGAAATAADTAAGKYAKMKIAIDESKESIGAGLLPVFELIVPKLQEFAEWAEKNSDKIADFTIKVGLFLTSIIVLNTFIKTITITMQLWKVITDALAFSMGILNGTIALNPLGLLITGAIVLIGYMVYLYNTSEDFRKKWDEIFTALREANAFIRGAFALAFGVIIRAVQPVVDIFQRLIDLWNNIKSAVGLSGTISTPVGLTSVTRQESYSGTVSLNEEQIARGISNILQRSDFRNGRLLGVV